MKLASVEHLWIYGTSKKYLLILKLLMFFFSFPFCKVTFFLHRRRISTSLIRKKTGAVLRTEAVLILSCVFHKVLAVWQNHNAWYKDSETEVWNLAVILLNLSVLSFQASVAFLSFTGNNWVVFVPAQSRNHSSVTFLSYWYFDRYHKLVKKKCYTFYLFSSDVDKVTKRNVRKHY